MGQQGRRPHPRLPEHQGAVGGAEQARPGVPQEPAPGPRRGQGLRHPPRHPHRGVGVQDGARPQRGQEVRRGGAEVPGLREGVPALEVRGQGPLQRHGDLRPGQDPGQGGHRRRAAPPQLRRERPEADGHHLARLLLRADGRLRHRGEVLRGLRQRLPRPQGQGVQGAAPGHAGEGHQVAARQPLQRGALVRGPRRVRQGGGQLHALREDLPQARRRPRHLLQRGPHLPAGEGLEARDLPAPGLREGLRPAHQARRRLPGEVQGGAGLREAAASPRTPPRSTPTLPSTTRGCPRRPSRTPR